MNKRITDPRNEHNIKASNHAKLRALQRYGIWLNDDDMKKIVGQVQTKTNARHIETLSNRRRLWEVDYKGKTLLVVYNVSRKVVLTVLPPDYQKENSK